MNRLFSFKSIYIKFVVVFVGILWFSSSIAFMIGFSFFKDNIITEIQQSLNTKATYIVEFNEKYNIKPQDLQKLLNDASVKISVFPNINDLTMLSDTQKQYVQKGQIVEITTNRRMPLPVVALKIQDSYVMLSASPSKDVMIFFRNLLGLVLLICALLGSALIAIASRMIVKPIKQLTTATKEVAKGNFDVKIITASKDEVGQLSTNFNLMTEELKNIEYLRKDFISSVSHEFKTPMTSIQGFAKLLKDKDLTEEQADEYTDIIISETGRLANLSNNLLRLSKLENQSIHEQHSNFSLSEQIRNVILLLEPKWSRKDLELNLELDEINYTGDEELLKQVWINLIENAIKFSNSGNSLKISIEKNIERIRVTIADSGVGIDAAHKNRIFERFYKVDKSRSNEGSGLGLPIVKRIVELHNGKIYFESTLGVGTTFIVELV